MLPLFTAFLLAAAGPPTSAELIVPQCLPSGAPAEVTGLAFPPSSEVTIARDGEPVKTVTADSAGAFETTIDVAPVDTETPVTFTGTAGAANATTTVTAVVPFGELRPDRGFIGRKVAVRYRGLRGGQPAFLHVRRGTRTVKTYRLTKAVDGCGPQTSRGRYLSKLPELEPRSNLVINGSQQDAGERPAARLKVPVVGKRAGLQVKTGYFNFVSAKFLGR